MSRGTAFVDVTDARDPALHGLPALPGLHVPGGAARGAGRPGRPALHARTRRATRARTTASPRCTASAAATRPGATSRSTPTTPTSAASRAATAWWCSTCASCARSTEPARRLQRHLRFTRRRPVAHHHREHRERLRLHQRQPQRDACAPGQGGTGGPVMLDASAEPERAHLRRLRLADGYTHDSQCVDLQRPGHRLHRARDLLQLQRGHVTIVDVTNKSAPVDDQPHGLPGAGLHAPGLAHGRTSATSSLDDELDE